jgi:type II secretory pathway pseudopilin PulG
MKQNIQQAGMSIIEILIYVAILAVIGVVLSNYFVAALSTQSEHDRRDDLASGAQNISAAFRQDAAQSESLLEPPVGATSSQLLLSGQGGAILFQQNGSTLNRIFGSSTTPLINERVRIRELMFTSKSFNEPRLGATTTSVQYHVLLEHLRAPGMLRSIDGTLLIGKDIL